MFIKNKIATRKYITVGTDPITGLPKRRLSQEVSYKDTPIKVSQTTVVGGTVIGIISYRELYTNPFCGSIPYDVNQFVEISAEAGKVFRDGKASAFFPSYMAVKDFL